MKRHVLSTGAAVFILGLASCSPQPVTYYRVGVAQLSELTGMNCPAVGSDVVTLSGIDGDSTIAVYAQPNNDYVVDVGSVSVLKAPAGVAGGSVTLNGSLSNGNYSFSGDWTQNDQGVPNVQTGVSMSLTMTPSGPGFTGTVTFQYSCTTTDTVSCGPTNPLATLAGADIASTGNSFGCTRSGSIIGSKVPNPTETPATATGLSQ